MNYSWMPRLSKSQGWESFFFRGRPRGCKLDPNQSMAPGYLSSGHAVHAACPYAGIGLDNGAMQTSLSMPFYNPNTTQVRLDHNSTTANARPMLLTEYQLTFGQSVPASITAQLTFNGSVMTRKGDSVNYPWPTFSYTYHTPGQLSRVYDAGTPGVPTVTLSYGYDAYGDRTSLSDSLGGSISYTFDAVHNLTVLALTANSVTSQVTLGYDAANRLTGITRTTPTVGGGGASPDTGGGGGGGNVPVSTSLSYDNANRLANITHFNGSTGATLASYTYGYDTASELTSYQDNNNSSLSYSYDANGELTGATGTLNGSSYSVSYDYDANGNRTMSGYQTGTGNELLNDGTYSYTYDKDGNLLTQTNISTGSVTSYTWDYRNRLTEVEEKTSNGTVVYDEKFTYDVNNNRIAASLNGTTQLYTVYDGSNPYIDFNGSGALTERYLTNPQALSVFYGQQSSSGATEWFPTDNINSIRLVVSTTGSVLDAITYDPYGNILNQTSTTYEPRYLYAGGAYDSNTDMYLDGVREVDPFDGRWLSQDPSGFAAGDTNLYRYVENNPTSLVDPTGLQVAFRAVVTHEQLIGQLQKEMNDLLNEGNELAKQSDEESLQSLMYGGGSIVATTSGMLIAKEGSGRAVMEFFGSRVLPIAGTISNVISLAQGIAAYHDASKLQYINEQIMMKYQRITELQSDQIRQLNRQMQQLEQELQMEREKNARLQVEMQKLQQELQEMKQKMQQGK